MDDVYAMLRTRPAGGRAIDEALFRCIEQCQTCRQACIMCADACLGEESVTQLAQCIRLNSDCADVCTAAGSVASRLTGSNDEVIHAMLEACAIACRRCAEECEKHAGRHDHCRVCAAACWRCEKACAKVIGLAG